MNAAKIDAKAPATRQMRTPDAATPPDPPVLLATDFSLESEAALIWAGGHARSIGAPLKILHVIHDPGDSPGTYRADGEDALEPMADVAERRLTDFVQRVRRDHPRLSSLDGASLLCLQGLPAAKILDVAQSEGAQILVLGGGRRNGLGRLLHGSTAHQVLRHAQVPVTIVNAGS